MLMKFKSPEGATPIDDAEGLIPSISTRTELNAIEAENILQAMDKHLMLEESKKAMADRFLHSSCS